MPNIENTANKKIAFVDYKPAKLQKGSVGQWRIVYYAKKLTEDKLVRFRVRVPDMPYQERLKYAQRMILSINEKLQYGWSPFYEEKSKQYKTLQYCFDYFFLIIEREIQDGVKRSDTLRAYKSCYNLFMNYLKSQRKNELFIVDVDVYLISRYLDYIYLERKNSPRTYNNHLGFLVTFFEFCKSKGFMMQNPAQGIKSKTVSKKKRVVLNEKVKEKVKLLQKIDFHYYVLCMCCYYLFLRRTELTKIKVSDVNLSGGYITVNAEISKNKKEQNVTIPNVFLPDLALHLSKASNSDFLFSDNDFKAGKKPISPKKISDRWEKFRKQYKIPSENQFYSLKDTGITDLLNSGVPSIKVRDQARHHDLKMTEIYTARNEYADTTIQEATFNF